MTRLPIRIAALLLAFMALPVRAGPLVDVAVVDRDHGHALPQYPHAGDRWVAGMPGHRYALRLTNTTGARVLVVVSVDGVNAVTGQTAAPNQAGYVLDPWETTEITGWRKSLDDVAQFVFTDPADSYAARTGRPRNVGVIGVAAFREREPGWRRPPITHSEAVAEAAAPQANDAAKRESRAQSAQGLGTGHGEREWAPVGSTTFVRSGRQPVQVSEIRYDAPRRLRAMGILPRPHHHIEEDAPRAFPGGFVADPPHGR